MTTAGGDLVRKAEAARRLGYSKSLISKEARPGGKLAEAVTGDGRIDMAVAERLLADRVDRSKGSTGGHGNLVLLTDEDRRIKRAKADKAEADAAAAIAAREERLRNLVDRAEYDRQVFTRIRALRDLLMTIPAALGDELAAKTDPREIKAMVTTAVRDALQTHISAIKDEEKTDGTPS